jgi:hypothetical protein
MPQDSVAGQLSGFLVTFLSSRDSKWAPNLQEKEVSKTEQENVVVVQLGQRSSCRILAPLCL